MKKNIAVVMGGYSREVEISINSGDIVFKHLNREKFNIFRVLILKMGWFVVSDEGTNYPINRSDFSVSVEGQSVKFDCIFNAIHGTPGENGLFQAYLELLQIPHTSCDFYQAALTFNKRDLISVLRPLGVRVADNYFLDKGDKINVEEIVRKVGLPCFVKANRAGSSFGVSKVKEEKDFILAIETAFKEDDEIIIESYLDGTEVDVGVMRWKGQITVFPVTEVVSENEFFDYSAKYLGKSREITPARISEQQTIQVQEISKLIYQKLKLKGITRMEFIFHKGAPFFLEVNTNPGLTEASIIPKQASAAGITLQDLFENAIDESLLENSGVLTEAISLVSVE